jgi:cephalosporin hydroxylase
LSLPFSTWPVRILERAWPLLVSFALGAGLTFGLLDRRQDPAQSPDPVQAPVPVHPDAGQSPDPVQSQNPVDEFHRRYYKRFRETWTNTYWLGVQTLQMPLDMWIFQEMIHEVRPDVFIEAGTAFGGSALYFASVFDLLDHGRVITIDIKQSPKLPVHSRINYLVGSSVSEEILTQVRGRIRPGESVMVSLDSDHRKDHVLQELRSYGPLVTRGSYLVVQDTNVNGHPVDADFGPGPMEAAEEFLAENGDFEVDRSREKYEFTFNPRGYLKRVR